MYQWEALQVRGMNLVVCFFSTSRRRPEKTAWPAVGVHRFPGQVQMAVDLWAPLLLFSVNRAPPVGAFPAGQVAPRHPGPHCVLRPAPVARATICRVVRLGEQPSSWTGFHYPLACYSGNADSAGPLNSLLPSPTGATASVAQRRSADQAVFGRAQSAKHRTRAAIDDAMKPALCRLRDLSSPYSGVQLHRIDSFSLRFLA